jgi:nocturnin
MALVVLFVLLLFILAEGVCIKLDSKRKWVTAPNRPPPLSGKLRVLQYNVLGDGLSGLRSDLGGFFRADKQNLLWDHRRNLILSELADSDADVICLQECDHFHDFFFPELQNLGYSGVFAQKPASACLEVSNSSDGCAVFVKSSKIRILTSEVSIFRRFDSLNTGDLN